MATLFPLPEPEPQFCDANGVPYAGGTITTYVPGTDTFQNTWSNMEGTALNTNPIVLDAAGRALIYGTGNFRFVLKDAAGNLIFDQETSAVDPSGFATPASVAAAVQAETDRAEAAESALTTNTNTETTRATNAENSLASDIGKLGAQLGPFGIVGTPGTADVFFFQGGESATDATGHVFLTFPVAYHGNPVVLVQVIDPSGTSSQIVSTVGYTTPSGVDVYTFTAGTGASIGCGFAWFSWGSG